MTRATLGTLSIEVPEGWEDQSILSFIGPPAPAAGLLRAKPEGQERPNLLMKRDTLVREVALEAYASAQEELLLRVVPGSSVLARTELTVLDGVPALCRELAIPGPSGEMRQLQVTFVMDGAYYTFAGTAPLGIGFTALRAQFLAIVAGIAR